MTQPNNKLKAIDKKWRQMKDSPEVLAKLAEAEQKSKEENDVASATVEVEPGFLVEARFYQGRRWDFDGCQWIRVNDANGAAPFANTSYAPEIRAALGIDLANELEQNK